jgi:hypothetical protein
MRIRPLLVYLLSLLLLFGACGTPSTSPEQEQPQITPSSTPEETPAPSESPIQEQPQITPSSTPEETPAPPESSTQEELPTPPTPPDTEETPPSEEPHIIVLPDDATTLHGKVLAGYQGWFGCPGDGSERDRWVGWFFEQDATASSVGVDYWPDVSELTPDALFKTNMTLPDGSPAMVFSSYNAKTVDRHFQWMEEYSIDGVLAQRFISRQSNPVEFANDNQIAINVRAAAEAHGRVFIINYDMAGIPYTEVVEAIKNDWMFLVDELKITESPCYLHHNGRPLLAIYGFGITGIGAVRAQELIQWLRTDAPEKYRVTLMGNIATNWRTYEGFIPEATTLWAEVFRSFDIVSPWVVGRFSDEASVDHFRKDFLLPDMAEAAACGFEYVPYVWPGSSWHNIKPEYDLNQIPRNGGYFFWRQVYNTISAGADALLIAMFDEVNEGTSMFKMAPTAQQVPAQGYFVPLDIDGYNLPSDWYLRLAGEAGKALRGEIPLSPELPLSLDIPFAISPHRLRIEYATTSEWAKLDFAHHEHLFTPTIIEIYDTDGSVAVRKDGLGLGQQFGSLEEAENVGVIVDYGLAVEALDEILTITLQKGHNNGSRLRVFIITGDEADLLIEKEFQPGADDSWVQIPLNFAELALAPE